VLAASLLANIHHPTCNCSIAIVVTCKERQNPKFINCIYTVTLYNKDNISHVLNNISSKRRLLAWVISLSLFQPSVLWRCWLGGRKGTRPVKNWQWWGTGMVICLERDADLHTAQLMPLPLTVSCFSKIQIGFTFLVPAHPGSPGKRVVKWVCYSRLVYSGNLQFFLL